MSASNGSPPMADEMEQTILRGLIDRRIQVEGPDFDYADESVIAYARSVRAALERAGYRREVDVLREAAPGLIDRAAAAARRMAGADSLSASIMASIVRSALWQALGCTCSDHSDVGAVYIEDLTCPMHGSVRATALEQAQPLLAAAGHSERCGKIGALRPTANRDDSEIVTLGPCPLPPGHDGRCDLRSPLPVADGSEVEPVEPCGSDIGVFQPRTCVLPKGHGGDWHDDGSACWSTSLEPVEPSEGQERSEEKEHG